MVETICIGTMPQIKKAYGNKCIVTYWKPPLFKSTKRTNSTLRQEADAYLVVDFIIVRVEALQHINVKFCLKSEIEDTTYSLHLAK